MQYNCIAFRLKATAVFFNLLMCVHACLCTFIAILVQSSTTVTISHVALWENKVPTTGLSKPGIADQSIQKQGLT